MEPEVDNSLAAVSLQEYWQILRRRRTIIIQSFLIVAVVGTILTMLAKPVYQASARILVDPPSMTLNTGDLSNPLNGILNTPPPLSVPTQVELLQSRPLLSAFKGRIDPNAISVSQVKDTNIIEVTAESSDPNTAASVPNTLLQAYLDKDSNQNLKEVQNAEAFARDQGAAAHQRLLEIEQEFRDFKKKHRVSDLTKDRDAQIQHVSDLTSIASKAEMDLQAMRSQTAVTRRLWEEAPKTTSSDLPMTNPARAQLQADISRLESERNAMKVPGGWGPKSSQMLAANARIDALKKQLAAEPLLITTVNSTANSGRDALKAQLDSDLAAEASLEKQASVANAALTDAKSHVGQFADWEVTLANLSREHDAAAAADSMFSQKLADLTLRIKAQHASARLIQKADVPTRPVRPKRIQSILFSCLIGLFVGLCLALLQEFLDDRINSVDEGVRLLDLPSLGVVPALSATDARLLPKMKGLDPAAESYRVLRTNIHFAAVDAPVRTLLVTSSNPGEGKSTTAANLAFAMALDGKKVILVDTDLRRPSLHKLLGLKSVPGVTDVLLGHTTLNEALVENEDLPNLKTMTAGSTPPNPSELLNSRTFRNLVNEMSNRADIVIFDSPPVLVTADAPILASQLDGTVLVVETGQTKKTALRRSVQLLRQARANVLGAAYNKMRAQDGGDYYYYQYHYSTPTIENKNGASGHLTGGEDGNGLIVPKREGKE